MTFLCSVAGLMVLFCLMNGLMSRRSVVNGWMASYDWPTTYVVCGFYCIRIDHCFPIISSLNFNLHFEVQSLPPLFAPACHPFVSPFDASSACATYQIVYLIWQETLQSSRSSKSYPMSINWCVSSLNFLCILTILGKRDLYISKLLMCDLKCFSHRLSSWLSKQFVTFMHIAYQLLLW